MTFGVYRPKMGVANGMRVLCSDQTLQEQRRVGEQNGRQAGRGAFNPITGEAIESIDGRGAAAATRNHPPGHLQPGLHPMSGPMDPVTVPGKDVYGRKPDPTRNQSTMGGDGLCAPASDDGVRPRGSRLTEGHLELGEGGLQPLAPEVSAPRIERGCAQVTRANIRPKDHLSGGCITSDRPEHPLALPRKAGSGAPGTGSGGPVHLVPGPNGFVPAGPGMEPEAPVEKPRRLGGESYRPVWG
mmetsp:Transcript_70401/g.142545  ORF Transcript_70401/g.142545 Transcript_70401/m.142545 type:complete len:242 (+) Transcript_70401:68-793(+)